MYISIPTADADDLVFDDDETFAPAPDAHPAAKAAASARDAAARNREWRAREKDRATLDAVLVDAMVSAQMHGRYLQRHRTGSADTLPPPVMMGDVMRLAYRELRTRGWEKTKASEMLAARLGPKRPPMEPL